MTHTQQQTNYAEAAYASLINRTLFDMCDFEEVEHQPEYHLFERYIAEDQIEVCSFPFQNDTTFYIDGDSKKLQEIAEELEAYFLADDTIARAYLADDGTEGESLFFIVFKNDTVFVDAEKSIIDSYGYVAFWCDQNRNRNRFTILSTITIVLFFTF